MQDEIVNLKVEHCETATAAETSAIPEAAEAAAKTDVNSTEFRELLCTVSPKMQPTHLAPVHVF